MTTTTAVKRETPQPLPKLAPRWRHYINQRAGFAIGVPPRWKIAPRRRATLLRSPDRLIAVSATADRSPAGRGGSLDAYAKRTLQGLSEGRPEPDGGPALYEHLRPGRARRFRDTYDAVAIPALGRGAKGGVPQRLLLVVERRDALVTYPILVASNASHRSRFAGQVPTMLRTLRGRPPGEGGSRR